MSLCVWCFYWFFLFTGSSGLVTRYKDTASANDIEAEHHKHSHKQQPAVLVQPPQPLASTDPEKQQPSQPASNVAEKQKEREDSDETEQKTTDSKQKEQQPEDRQGTTQPQTQKQTEQQTKDCKDPNQTHTQTETETAPLKSNKKRKQRDPLNKKKIESMRALLLTPPIPLKQPTKRSEAKAFFGSLSENPAKVKELVDSMKTSQNAGLLPQSRFFRTFRISKQLDDRCEREATGVVWNALKPEAIAMGKELGWSNRRCEQWALQKMAELLGCVEDEDKNNTVKAKDGDKTKDENKAVNGKEKREKDKAKEKGLTVAKLNQCGRWAELVSWVPAARSAKQITLTVLRDNGPALFYAVYHYWHSIPDWTGNNKERPPLFDVLKEMEAETESAAETEAKTDTETLHPEDADTAPSERKETHPAIHAQKHNRKRKPESELSQSSPKKQKPSRSAKPRKKPQRQAANNDRERDEPSKESVTESESPDVAVVFVPMSVCLRDVICCVSCCRVMIRKSLKCSSFARTWTVLHRRNCLCRTTMPSTVWRCSALIQTSKR